jgi:hypothetical protein
MTQENDSACKKMNLILPIKIFIEGGNVKSAIDSSGKYVKCEVWDADIEGVGRGHPKLKSDENGRAYFFYTP